MKYLKTNVSSNECLRNLNLNNPTVFNFEQVTYNEIRDIVSLKNSHSKDFFGYNIKIIINIPNIIVYHLTKLINYCLEKGIYPSTFKISNVVPVYKKGAAVRFQNTISLVPLFNKVFEKAVKRRISDCHENNNLFSKQQFV